MRYHALALATASLLARGLAACDGQVKNFIYIVPDGYGAASQTLARDYLALLGQDPAHPVIPPLSADKLTIGNVRTVSDDSLITDSAAAATAFACGVKTQNGVISLDDEGHPVGSVLEAAKLDGMKTGLVATSRITHATPACYAAHVHNRDNEGIIAEQQVGKSHPLGSVVDVLMGGGRCFFQPQQTEGSCRSDDVDLISWAEDNSFKVVTDRDGFDSLGNSQLPYIGLFHEDHMNYELDRNPAKEPSLFEMTEQALKSLKNATSASDKGYFLMVEASRIDHAGHANDAAGHLHDTIMYNKVMDLVRHWVDDNPDTVMLSAADHECGGLTLDGFSPLALKNAKNTTATLDPEFANYNGDSPAHFLRTTILPAYGVYDATEDEIETLIEHKGKSDFANVLGSVLADRAGVSWSTDGHSSVDVTLFGYGADCRGQELRSDMTGHHDNTELPYYVEKVLGLNLKKATAALKKNGVDWVPQPDPNLAKRDHLHQH